MVEFLPLIGKAGEHGYSSRAAVVQPKLQQPYHLVDQKLSFFSSTIPSMLEKPARNNNGRQVVTNKILAQQ